jgi:hypothetical protein
MLVEALFEGLSEYPSTAQGKILKIFIFLMFGLDKTG